MFEDDTRNLRVPHEMGMRTVHVAPDPAPADPGTGAGVDTTGALLVRTDNGLRHINSAEVSVRPC